MPKNSERVRARADIGAGIASLAKAASLVAAPRLLDIYSARAT
jgi:hypothetical protein